MHTKTDKGGSGSILLCPLRAEEEMGGINGIIF